MTRILLIDDDRSLLELLSGYLVSQGYETATASSGIAGLEAFAADGADLILLDVTMRGLDGWQVLGRLRKRSVMRNGRR
jgi:DNA-binding response OmpR family regulator